MTSRLMKKRVSSCSSATSSIKSLPRDLLLEVIATIASESFHDLQNMKTCCKDFHEATEDTYVLQKVSLDKFPLIQWFPNERELSFLKRCRESENKESLFREGLREYFKCPNGNINGLKSIKIAAEKGHREAIYVYGMILLCSDDDVERKEGLEHVRFLMEKKCVVSCRKKVKYLTYFMWKNNGMLVRNRITPMCDSKNTCGGWRVKKGRWALLEDVDDDDEDVDGLCEFCRWDHELEFFYNLFNN